VSAVPAAEQDAEAVRALLRLARGITSSGRRVDLHGLDRMVGRLCARCLDLPPADGRRMRLLLTELHVEIGSLNATMATAPP